MSKVSRRTVDTGTSLVADGMCAKTLQFCCQCLDWCWWSVLWDFFIL